MEIDGKITTHRQTIAEKFNNLIKFNNSTTVM
jgi:hypothetical protein